MRCYICDSALSDNEIQWHPEIKKWEPCGTCLMVIEETFEPLDDEHIRRQIEEEVEENG